MKPATLYWLVVRDQAQGVKFFLLNYSATQGCSNTPESAFPQTKIWWASLVPSFQVLPPSSVPHDTGNIIAGVTYKILLSFSLSLPPAPPLPLYGSWTQNAGGGSHVNTRNISTPFMQICIRCNQLHRLIFKETSRGRDHVPDEGTDCYSPR